MKVLAHATCERAGHPDRVRFNVITWRKRLGRVATPTKDAKTKLILDWDCTQAVRLPDGRRI